MAFLTPVGGLVALAALLPLAAPSSSRAPDRRRAFVRCGSTSPERQDAPPGFVRCSPHRASRSSGSPPRSPCSPGSPGRGCRSDVQALFVLDISRSMAASHAAVPRPASTAPPPRRSSCAAPIPDVPAGVADPHRPRAPDLLPVRRRSGFDGVVRRAVRIESPPPRRRAVRATTFPRSARSPRETPSRRREATDRRPPHRRGEQRRSPPAAAALARAGYDFVAVRFWSGDESVFDADGTAEAAYRPDPSGRAVLHDLASSLGGRSYEESELGRQRPISAHWPAAARPSPVLRPTAAVAARAVCRPAGARSAAHSLALRSACSGGTIDAAMTGALLRAVVAATGVLAAGALLASASARTGAEPNVGWGGFGNTPDELRHSPLTEITTRTSRSSAGSTRSTSTRSTPVPGAANSRTRSSRTGPST